VPSMNFEGRRGRRGLVEEEDVEDVGEDILRRVVLNSVKSTRY
jgi:hypothetical protein